MREEEEERRRELVDEEERQIQLKARREAIERANELLYQQTDKVKAFNCKLMLSDVIEVIYIFFICILYKEH